MLSPGAIVIATGCGTLERSIVSVAPNRSLSKGLSSSSVLLLRSERLFSESISIGISIGSTKDRRFSGI